MTRIFAASISLLALAIAGTAHAQQPLPEEEGGIVVTGQRAQLQRSIDQKRAALGIVDVTASDDMGQLPDKNVAEAVERLGSAPISGVILNKAARRQQAHYGTY